MIKLSVSHLHAGSLGKQFLLPPMIGFHLMRIRRCFERSQGIVNSMATISPFHGEQKIAANVSLFHCYQFLQTGAAEL